MSENLPAQVQQHDQPFGRMLAAQSGINAGAVAIEQERAIAEARGQIQLAKMFPRSMTGAMNEFLESCKSADFAAQAFYSVPNRGSGPSIRFAEEAARCYGNFEYGHRELSRSEGRSEIEVYAWDKEKNNFRKRQITVMHVRDKSGGATPLRDQPDIDNRIANVASKQMRGCILALLPKHMVAAGQAACKVTVAGGGEKPLSERIVAMVQAFGRFGVNKAHLETHLGHDIDNTTVDELADLIGIYNAIKEGGKASEYFPLGEAAESTSAATAAAITQQAKQAAATTTPKATRTTKPAAEKSAQQPQQEQQQAAAKDSKPAESDSSAVKDPDAGITENPAASQADAAASKPQAQAATTNPDDDVF